MTNMAKSLQPPPPDPDLELTAEVMTKLIVEVREDLERLAVVARQTIPDR
jgi:hypothetical protein